MASLGGPAGSAKGSEMESATGRASADPVHSSRVRESKEIRTALRSALPHSGP